MERDLHRRLLTSAVHHSAIHRAPRAFHAIGVLWTGQIAELSVRVSPDAVSWTEWFAVTSDLMSHGPSPVGYDGFSDLLTVPPSEYLQYRLRPTGREGTLTCELIDSRLAAPTLPSASASWGQLNAVPSPPSITSRSAWGANETYRFNGSGSEIWPREYRVTQKGAVHHTATANFESDPAATVRAIYYYHAVTLGWGDIGYHYLVDWRGTIYEGRAGGANVVGGHTLGHNPGNVGVACLGTFSAVSPTAESVNAIVQLLGWRCQFLDPLGQSFFFTTVLPNLMGHRDAVATTCPGDQLHAQLPAIRAAVLARLGATPVPDAQISNVRLYPALLPPGDALRVHATIANTGTGVMISQGPAPDFEYAEGESFSARGHPEITGAWRVAADYGANSTGIDHPYRWGLDDALEPGQSTVVTGLIRLATSRVDDYWLGVVRENVGWTVERTGDTRVVVSSTIQRQLLPLAPRGDPP